MGRSKTIGATRWSEGVGGPDPRGGPDPEVPTRVDENGARSRGPGEHRGNRDTVEEDLGGQRLWFEQKLALGTASADEVRGPW